MKICDIKIHNRHRKLLGDIHALADSMKDVGLLQPVVVDADGNLEEIHRRLRAERDENTCREPFLPTEAAALADALAPFEKKAAQERRATPNAERVKLTPSEKGKAADKVAEAVDMSRATLTKVKQVVHAAKVDPENYGDLPDKMDADKKKIDPVHREMLERAVKFPIPDGPTPAQIARNSAAVKWAKNIHECWVVLNSIRDNGGVAKLVSSWSDDERDNYVTELKQFRDAANEWIDTLEKSCSKRKTA
jgi:hypothetical protein